MEGSIGEGAAAKAAGSRTVLLAAPGPALRRTARALLEEAGYKVMEAGDGLDALCQLAGRRPHLALLDKECPGLDGFQLCALLKSRAEYRDIPVMLLAGAGDVFEQARAGLLEAAGVLGKPFDREELLEALRLAEAARDS